MLTELRNRGLQDALMVCCDGLKRLPESIRTTKAMREIYTAPTVEAADVRGACLREMRGPVRDRARGASAGVSLYCE